MSEYNDPKAQEQREELRKREEEELVQLLSDRYGIPYIDLTAVSINIDALKVISEGEARKLTVAAFGIAGKNLRVAVLAPKKDGLDTLWDDLKRKGYVVELFMASNQSLEKAWNLYKDASFATETQAGVLDISSEQVEKLMRDIKSVADLRKYIGETIVETKRYKVSRIIELFVSGSLAVGASDIHLEPEESGVRVRFRIDGVLQDMATISHDLYHFLVSRIKLLSGVKLNIKEGAQDGRFTINISIGDVEVRTSVIPGSYGEAIVMRILNPLTIAVSFETLGMEPELFRAVEKAIEKPNGMILNTGPTGSGKTTSLYAFLRKVHTPEIKILTIEDPVEYHLQGITQTQVEKEKGYTFLSGLRAALRQDPDIIMVGEIRDTETAETAVNAALTGHLVFSTLHTNNAAGIFPRLIDLGVNPKTIVSALTIGLAQRLVRKLCDVCKIEGAPNAAEKELIANVLEKIKAKRNITLQEDRVWTARVEPNGPCEKCGGVGYKGRIGVYEGIVMNDEIEKAITGASVSEREVKKAAETQNLLTMREDGIVKVLTGLTSIEELGRAVDLDEE